MSKVTAVGIDLGTTYSCVAVAQNGKVRIVENEQGNRTTPSCVAFTELEHIIGDVAKTQSALNPTNTVFDAKRLIGRNFSDPTVQADIKHWPFKVVNVNGRPKIEIVFKGEKKRFFPEEISSMVLTKMKETAETFVGSAVKDVVVTVPAYFNNSQRMSTKNAGRLAGLNVLRIINEPTAAALAYGMDHKSSEKRHVLVYDLGGGTFDVSIVTLENGVVEVKATGGDTHLGGEDFDNRLVDHFVKEIAQKHKVDLKGDMKTLRRLRNACERAKRNLSSATQTYIDIECNGKNFLSTISRARFEGMNEDLFSSTLETVDTVIKDAGISKNLIHEVVLVGGSTRIPRIQDMLKEYFGDVGINKSINPDEAVAYGAAIHASVIQGDVSEAMKDLVLLDVTPLSLGIDTMGDKMSVIIKRNTSIPCSLSQSYCTVCDDQTKLDFSVHEGERIIASENTLLAKFTVDDIPPAPAGCSGHTITFNIDNNGILHVTSVVKGTGAKLKMSITDQLWLKSDDIEKMLQDAETFRQIDAKRSERLVAISDLEVYCYNSKRRIQKKFNRTGTTQSDRALSDIAECMKWLDSNNEADAQVYKNRLAKLKIICNPLINV